MHRYNNKYGYGAILRSFCGVKPTTPIWGEVQHSLFLNTRYFTADGRLGPPREQLQRFPRLLSWQTLLPFPYQIPIGDPLLYAKQEGLFSSYQRSSSDLTGDFAVFMPKLNDEVPAEERFRQYKAGLRKAIDRLPQLEVVVALHPREYENREAVVRELGNLAEVLWAPGDYQGGPTAWSHHLIGQAQAVVSDYFGAHVFRAAGLLNTPVVLVGGSLFNPGFHPVMKNLTHEFLEASEDFPTQQAIAGVMLGLEFMRPKDELSHILGFRGTKKVIGRPVRVAYRRIRRVKVSRRRRQEIRQGRERESRAR